MEEEKIIYINETKINELSNSIVQPVQYNASGKNLEMRDKKREKKIILLLVGLILALVAMIVITFFYYKNKAKNEVVQGLKYLHETQEYEYNPEEAVSHFKKAIHWGSDDAKFLAGYTLYYENQDVDYNDIFKSIWYFYTCKNENPFATIFLDDIYRSLVEEYQKLFDKLPGDIKSEKISGNDERYLLENTDCAYYAEACFAMAKYYEHECNYNKEVEWLERAVECGNYFAMKKLGNIYYFGDGVDIDYDKAFELFSRSAVTGDCFILDNLACCYRYGKGVEANQKTAVDWFYKASEAGNTNAMLSLGQCYYAGDGVERDYEKAIDWYQKAADYGNKAASYYIGFCYEYGRGVEQDYETALYLYQYAADNGIVFALDAYENCYKAYIEQNEDGYEDNTDVDSDTDDVYSMVYAADNYYYNGEYESAFELYEKAAQLDNPSALFNLAIMYGLGYGVEEDDEKAVYYYEKAANLGHLNAMTNLGIHYYQGYHVEQDFKKAFNWLTKAAEAGDSRAMFCLGDYYFDGDAIEQDIDMAMMWYQKSIDEGDYDSYAGLGDCYEALGNLEEALNNYEKAANVGNSYSMLKLVEMYSTGKGTAVNQKKADEWQKKFDS